MNKIVTQFISKEDLNWLSEDLTKNNLPTIICLHFGVAEDDMEGNWWFESCPEHALLGNRKELKQIIKEYPNVLAVFYGHQHWTKYIKEAGGSYYVLGSLTKTLIMTEFQMGVFYNCKRFIKIWKKSY